MDRWEIPDPTEAQRVEWWIDGERANLITNTSFHLKADERMVVEPTFSMECGRKALDEAGGWAGWGRCGCRTRCGLRIAADEFAGVNRVVHRRPLMRVKRDHVSPTGITVFNYSHSIVFEHEFE